MKTVASRENLLPQLENIVSRLLKMKEEKSRYTIYFQMSDRFFLFLSFHPQRASHREPVLSLLRLFTI